MYDGRVSRERVLLTLVALVGLAATTFAFVARIAPLQRFFGHALWPLLLATPLLLAVLGTGVLLRWLVERRFGATRVALPAPVVLGLDLAVGLPALGTLCFVLACVDCSRALLTGPALALAALGLLSLRGRASALHVVPLEDWPSFACFACVALGLLGAAMVAQLPPFTIDEVAYHMAAPKAWIQEGRVTELPLNSHSYFPFGVESAALPLLLWAGETGTRAFHFVILALFATGLGLGYAWLESLGGRRSAALAVAVLASTPPLVLTGGVAWVDAPLLALTFALCIRLSRALEEGFEPPTLGQLALVVAAGTLTKYTWSVALVAGFVATAIAARGSRKALVGLAASGAAGVALGSVFFVRNALWTGNPVAPFLDAATPAVTGFNTGTSQLELWKNYLYDGTMVDESIGPTLLGLALAFAVLQRSLAGMGITRALGVMSTLGLLALGTLGAAGRLLLPFACVAGVLGVLALERATAEHPRAQRLVALAVLMSAYVQLTFAMTAVAQYEPFAPLSTSDAEIVARERPIARATAFIDAQLPPDSLTLVLGIHESYDFAHRVRTGGNFDGPRVARYLIAESPAALYAKLRRDGFTHVAVYAKSLLVGEGQERGRQAEWRTRISVASSARLSRLLQEHADSVAQGEGVMVFALRAEPGPR